MKYLLVLFLVLSTSTVFAQAPKTEVLKIVKDTVYSALSIYTEDQKLIEKRYFRELESQRRMTNEDLFMRGISRLQDLDSIALFAYDQNWKLKDSIIFTGEEALKHDSYRYSKEEFEVKTNPVQLIGRTGSYSSFALILKSLSPQDLDITIRPLSNDSIIHVKSTVLTNREVDTFTQEIKLRPGIHRFDLLVETSNKQSKRTILESRGYDLLDADFTIRPEETIELSIKGDRDIYIQVLGNNKLLTLKNGTKAVPLPVSTEHFTLEKDLVPAGSYILELQNLKTGEKRLCRMKVL